MNNLLSYFIALESAQSELFDVKSKLDEENEARYLLNNSFGQGELHYLKCIFSGHFRGSAIELLEADVERATQVTVQHKFVNQKLFTV